MSAPVRLERTKRLLSTPFPPSIPPSSIPPSLPAAGFMSSPGLSSISVTHRPHYWGCSQTGWAADGKGLQDIYGFCSLDKDLRVRPQKYVVIWVWTRQCLQHVCERECENVPLHRAAVGVWAGCILVKHLNWFGHWELKAVDLNMKDMIIQWPSGLLVSSD